MKLYAPKYFTNFHCIADRCNHSCCVGWEIDIDDITMQKYAALGSGYGDNIKASIEDGDPPHFRLCTGDRCPHLDCRGLCKIITNLGEDHLCDICREHPRFYNYTSRGCFVGLGLSCEEACRIVLSSDSYAEIIEIGHADGEPNECTFDAAAERNYLFGILSDISVPLCEKISRITSEYSISLPENAEELLSSLEYLDPSHLKLFLKFDPNAKATAENEKILTRALAYFIYRHCTSSEDESEFRAALGFSLFCEKLLCSIAGTNTDIFDSARIISEEIEYSEDNTEAVKTEFLF